MSDHPVFHFRSVKEKPKTFINLKLKNNNIEFICNTEFDVRINDKKYVLDTKILLNCELNSEPEININYYIKSEEQLTFNINDLLIIMSDFKSKVENDIKNAEIIENENKLLEKQEIKHMEIEDIHNKKSLEEEDNKSLEEEERLRLEEEEKERLRLEEEEKERLRLEEEERLRLEEEEKERLRLEEEEKERLRLEEEEKERLRLEEEEKERLRLEEEEKERIRLEEEEKERIRLEEEENKRLEEEENKSLEEEEITKEEDKLIPKPKINHNLIVNYLKEELENIKKKDNKLNTKTDIKVDNALKIQLSILEHIKLILSDNPEMIYTNIIYVITELMKFVETINTEDFDKKSLIIKSIKMFLEYKNLNSPETELVLDTVCPELIDILLLVDKRKIVINKKMNCFFPWCA